MACWKQYEQFVNFYIQGQMKVISSSLELLYFTLLIMAKQVRDGEETPARANILTL
jgi:uncharacterized iron-regulated protein